MMSPRKSTLWILALDLLVFGMALACTSKKEVHSNRTKGLEQAQTSADIFRQSTAVSANDTGTTVTAKIDPSGDKALRVDGPSQSGDLGKASVVFPPGSLAVSTDVTLTEGVDLVGTGVLGELALETKAAGTGPALFVDSAQDQDALEPMIIALDIPDEGASLVQKGVLVVFYRIVVASEGKTYSGIYFDTDFELTEEHILIRTRYFGIFQAAFLAGPGTSKKVESTGPVAPKASTPGSTDGETTDGGTTDGGTTDEGTTDGGTTDGGTTDDGEETITITPTFTSFDLSVVAADGYVNLSEKGVQGQTGAGFPLAESLVADDFDQASYALAADDADCGDIGTWGSEVPKTTDISSIPDGDYKICVKLVKDGVAYGSTGVFTLDTAPPDPPSNVRIRADEPGETDETSDDDFELIFQWDAPEGDVEGYNVRMHASADCGDLTPTVSQVTSTTYTATITSAGTYSFSVQARDPAGNASSLSGCSGDIVVTPPASGSLVTSFGASGKQSYTVNENHMKSLAILPDDRIIAAGYSGDGTASSEKFLLVLLEKDGTFDSSFGTAGVKAFGAGTGQMLHGVTVDTVNMDTYIYAVGNNPETSNWEIYKFDDQGNLVTEFDSDGFKSFNPLMISASATPHAVVTDANHDVYVCGACNGGNRWAIAKFNGTNGSLIWSKSFENGLLNPDTTSTEVCNDLAIDEENGVVVAVGEGDDNDSKARSFAIVVLEKNSEDDEGDLSADFSDDGMLFLQMQAGAFDIAEAVLVHDGKYVIAGRSEDNSSYQDIAIAKIKPDGSMDTTFGTSASGKLIDDGPNMNTYVSDIMVDKWNRYVAVGRSLSTTYDNFVVRYDSSGTLDMTFGADGYLMSNDSCPNNCSDSYWTAGAIDKEDKIVVGGLLNITTPAFYFQKIHP